MDDPQITMTGFNANKSGSSKKVFAFAYWSEPKWKGFVGATVKIWDLAENLSLLGYKVTLFIPPIDEFPGLPKFKIIPIPFIRLPVISAISFNLMLIMKLVLCQDQFPDIVYVRRGISPLPGLFARMRNSVLIYEVNDDPYGNCEKDFSIKRWFHVKTDEFYIRLADLCSVITGEIKSKIISGTGESKDKMMILPSGSNINLYHPAPREQSCKRLNMEEAVRKICFIGSLLPHQGIETLIMAAPLIIQDTPRVEFFIIGEGPLAITLKEQVRRSELTQYFKFTGEVPYRETASWIGAADVCVAPYAANAGLRSPVKIFDYLACGKPVIASEIKGTTDFLIGTGAAELVPPQNPGLLAKAIMEVLNDNEKASSMGRKGRELVETLYDRRRITARLMEKAEAFFAEKRT